MVLQIIENSNDFTILVDGIKFLVNVIQENSEYKLILIDKKFRIYWKKNVKNSKFGRKFKKLINN